MTSEPRDGRARARLRPIYWIVGGLVLLAVLAWATLAILFPPARLRAIVQRHAGAVLQREVRFDGASLGVLPPVRLTIRNLAMAEPGGFANGTAIQVKSLHVDLDAVALMGRRVVVRRLEIVEPAAHIVLREDGSTNLANAPAGEKKPAATGMDFEVTRFEVHGGRLLLDDLKARRRTALGFDTGMSFGLLRGGTRVSSRGESRLSDVAFGPLSAQQVAQLDRSLAGLVWTIEHDAVADLPTKRIAFQKLGLVLGKTQLALTGMADGAATPPTVDLHARGAAIDLAQVLDYLAQAQGHALQGIDGGGRLDFDLAVRGPIGATVRPRITGTVTIRDGSFHYSGSMGSITNTSFVARIAPDSLQVSDLRAQVAGQWVSGRLRMARFADPLVSFALQGNLDLAAVERLMVAKDTKLGGRLALDVSGSGRAKDPGSIAFDGWVRPQAVWVESPQLPKKLEQVSGEVRFSNARALVKQLSGRAGQSSFVLDAAVTRPLALMAKHAPGGSYDVAPAGIDFTLGSRYLDLAELLPPTPGAPMLANVRGSGRIAIDRLKNQKLDVQNVSAAITLEPDVLDATRFTMKAYGGAISGKAHIELRDTAHPVVSVDAGVDSCLVDEALATWTRAGKLLHGIASTSLDLSVHGFTPEEIRRTLSAEGKATILNGKLGPAPALEEIARVTRIAAFKEVTFRDFIVPFKVQNGQVATGPAKLVGPLGEWQVSGLTGFDGSLDYAVSITLPADVTARLGRDAAIAAGALADESGRVLIDLRVTGNAKQPRVRLDSGRMRDRLLGRLGSVLAVPIPHIGTVRPDSIQNPDSLRAAEKRYRRALEDSLRNKAKGLLDGFFKPAKKDTAKTSPP